MQKKKNDTKKKSLQKQQRDTMVGGVHDPKWECCARKADVGDGTESERLKTEISAA